MIFSTTDLSLTAHALQQEKKAKTATVYDLDSPTKPSSASLFLLSCGLSQLTSADLDQTEKTDLSSCDPSSLCTSVPVKSLLLDRENRALNGGGQKSFVDSCASSMNLLGPSTSRATKKTKKIMYTLADSEDFDREELATYEEVARLFPRPGFFRPIILVGPPGVGRNEIKRRIIAVDPDRYRVTTPRKLAFKYILLWSPPGQT